MPFDYKDYQKKCDGLTTAQLQKEWENYTRQIAGGATSTATSVLFSPFTAGISLVGIGLSAPRIHNARKKREIIQAGLEARGETHNTRKRDVVAPMAVAGTLSGLTLGLAGPGADMIAGAAVGHGVEYAASHAALDATGAVVEHKHDQHAHKKAHQKLQAQYQSFQKEYEQQQAAAEPHVSANQTGVQELKPAFPLSPSSPVSQQGGRPACQHQLQSPPQDEKYEFVPAPSLHHSSISYQPVSHQQNLTQPAREHPIPAYQPPPSYTPAQQSHVGTGFASISSPHGPSDEASPPTGGINAPYVQDVPSSETQHSPPSPDHYAPISDEPSRPIPDKFGSNSDGAIHVTVYELDSQPVAAVEEGDDSSASELTMEEEIAILKAKILRMEIEKREGPIRIASTTFDQAPSMLQTSSGQSEISQINLGPSEPDIRLTPALASFVEHQDYPPPPASPTLSVASPITPSLQYLPDNQNTRDPYYPPPPPRPHSAHITQYQYPPPPLIIYNSANQQQQTYAPPPMPPRPQQEPQLQRQDSGYYSNPPSRHSSTFSTATVSTCSSPQQMLSPQCTGYSLLSPLSTGQRQHGLRHSISHGSISSSQVSPISPQPAPYFPPPPGSAAKAVSSGEDYFDQNTASPPPHIPAYQPGMGQPVQSQSYGTRPSFQGFQGWQWGVATTKPGEPNYGPPPAIPAPWKRS